MCQGPCGARVDGGIVQKYIPKVSKLTLEPSLAKAAERWGSSQRRPRADRGHGRLHPEVERKIADLVRTRERPTLAGVHAKLDAFCRRRGFRTPARTSIYNALDRVEVPYLDWETLPTQVREALYNQRGGDASLQMPGDQVVFYSFNYGSPRAVSYASGMDWLSLHRAAKRRGWRPKSRALLEAVLHYRNIR